MIMNLFSVAQKFKSRVAQPTSCDVCDLVFERNLWHIIESLFLPLENSGIWILKIFFCLKYLWQITVRSDTIK